MKYPISVQDFEKLITGKYVYVDKTDLVYELAQLNVCFLSRPRRFGKSLLISTLEAYFTGKKDLFKGLKIDELEKNQKLTKEEKNGIKKLAEFEASVYIKTLPDITKFQGYLDEFGIEYRHHIPPEEEYKDLEALPVLDYSKQIESPDF